MKTQSEKSIKYLQFVQQRKANVQKETNIRDDFPLDVFEERIQSILKPEEVSQKYENTSICYSYGQPNYEKATFALSLLITLAACFLYFYFDLLDKSFVIIYSSSLAFDSFIFLIYIYFLCKMKSPSIFTPISNTINILLDIINYFNFILKVIIFVFIFMDIAKFNLMAISIIVLMLLTHIYILLITVKILGFSPCFIYMQDLILSFTYTIKYYLCCCEMEQEEPKDYTKLEDVESFY